MNSRERLLARRLLLPLSMNENDELPTPDEIDDALTLLENEEN